jgi:hypothetical protein
MRLSQLKEGQSAQIVAGMQGLEQGNSIKRGPHGTYSVGGMPVALGESGPGSVIVAVPIESNYYFR